MTVESGSVADTAGGTADAVPPASGRVVVRAPSRGEAQRKDLRRLLAEALDRRRVGVIPLRGAIGGAMRTQETLRILDRARKDANIRAVLLDIDSPGGSATASEALFMAVRRLASAKPVVAWIRGVGASGSYFAACGATTIGAFPSAIVGSVGVISVRPVAFEALRKIGLSVAVTKTGEFKDLGAPWREPTDEDRERDRRLVDKIFARFTAAVATARHFDEAKMQGITTGEVWLGEEALGMGLVDQLFENEDDALGEARRLAGLPPHVRPVRMATRRTLAQRLGLPGASLRGSGAAWLVEMESWLSLPHP